MKPHVKRHVEKENSLTVHDSSVDVTKLYGTLLCSVLLLFGCERNDVDPATPEARQADTTAAAPAGPDERPGRILFLGNSLSAGYGVRQEEAFPSRIQRKIDALGWRFEVVNAGVSGDTSSGGLSRLDWLLRDSVDVFVLELGANDGLRGVPPEAMERNLRSIIRNTRERYPDVRILLAGMKMPPNLGRAYTDAFERVYERIAADMEVDLIPFLLEGVGGMASLNQQDGIHPTPEGHAVIAETVWEYLRPVLEELRERRHVA